MNEYSYVEHDDLTAAGWLCRPTTMPAADADAIAWHEKWNHTWQPSFGTPLAGSPVFLPALLGALAQVPFSPHLGLIL